MSAWVMIAGISDKCGHVAPPDLESYWCPRTHFDARLGDDGWDFR